MTNSSNEVQRYNTMLFDNWTTTRTDFQSPEFVPGIPTTCRQKRRCYRIRPPPLKHLHSMTEWKIPNVPFHMFWKPDPIIRRDPNKIQGRFEASVDVELGEVRKTRPRMIMTPAISLDDIKDDSVRELLTLDTYTTSAMYANRETASRWKESVMTKAPLPDRPACARPVSLPAVKPPRVPPEWRMDSVSWEGRQLRGYVRPTMEFWLGRKEITNNVRTLQTGKQQRQ